MTEYSTELRLKEPLTKEDWDLIADADFKNTNKVTFTTPHCGEVEFVKVVRCKDCKHRDTEDGLCKGRGWPMQLVPDDGFCDKGERSEDGEVHSSK